MVGLGRQSIHQVESEGYLPRKIENGHTSDSSETVNPQLKVGLGRHENSSAETEVKLKVVLCQTNASVKS